MKQALVLCLLSISLANAHQNPNYMNDLILSTLAQWPLEKPNVSEDHHSMFFNHQSLGKLLNQKTSLVIELGSWLGASTRFICAHAPNALVIAIDHWQGSPEHFESPDCKKRIDTLYETFLVNCWEYKNRLMPLRTTTLDGLEKIKHAGLYPDLVYVDASHDYESVTKDLEKIYELFPKTCICGDDWIWNESAGFPVQRAVIDFAQRHNFKIASHIHFWRLYR